MKAPKSLKKKRNLMDEQTLKDINSRYHRFQVNSQAQRTSYIQRIKLVI